MHPPKRHGDRIVDDNDRLKISRSPIGGWPDGWRIVVGGFARISPDIDQRPTRGGPLAGRSGQQKSIVDPDEKDIHLDRH